MSENPVYARIILPLPVETLFSYIVPDNLREKVRPGARVMVPFGKRKVYSGIVIGIDTATSIPDKIKPIESVLDEDPLVRESHLRFWEWIADYYMCTIGEVYRAALPAGLKPESETRYTLIEGGGEGRLLSREETILVKQFRDQGHIPVSAFNKEGTGRKKLALVQGLVAKGVLTAVEKIRDAYKPKKVTRVRLAAGFRNEDALNALLDGLGRAPKQRRILENLAGIADGGLSAGIDKSGLAGADGSGRAAIQALIKKGVLEEFQVVTGRFEWDDRPLQPPKKLSPAQRRALAQVRDSLESHRVVLLEGITSSGKTEIYIHLISDLLDKGRQVLYLLPEIALTTQIVERLRNVFGGKVGIYHSQYSDAERAETFLRVNDPGSGKEYGLVIGARSAVFLPFRELGLVIIDEEHENTYKQADPAPRYHARDAAIVLAGLHDASVVLGSATPSYESYYNARSGKYGHIRLAERFREIEPPEIMIADLRESYRKKRMVSLFTPELYELTRENLGNGQQVILFQNRRGFSPYLECFTCGHIPRCMHCDVSLTYHRQQNRLACHYCGWDTVVPGNCPECHDTNLHTRGFGTEKLEDEVSLLFPGFAIGRMDMDTTRTRRGYEKLIGDFSTGKTRILVGTQIITKGLDFENVALVGVLNADNLLNFPDFRSFERSFQLMLQVAGRAGRKDRRGKVVIQTSNPDHPVIRMLKKSDYHSMYLGQMEERKDFHYPPYYRLVQVTLKHKDREILEKASKDLAARLKENLDRQVLGPQSPLVSRTHDRYLMTILVKLPRTGEIGTDREIIRREIARIGSEKKYGRLILVADVDPM